MENYFNLIKAVLNTVVRVYAFLNLVNKICTN